MAGPVRTGLRRELGAEVDVRGEQRRRRESPAGRAAGRSTKSCAPSLMRSRPVWFMSNVPSLTRPGVPACMMPLAALSASPALMVMTPSTVWSFSSVRLDRLGDRGRVAEAVAGSGSCSRGAAGGGDAVDDALAARLEVGGARNGVDADDVLRAVLGEILAARLAGEILVGADVVDRAELACALSMPPALIEDHRDAGGDRGLDGLILGLGHPVRDRDAVGALADRGADEVAPRRRRCCRRSAAADR